MQEKNITLHTWINLLKINNAHEDVDYLNYQQMRVKNDGKIKSLFNNKKNTNNLYNFLGMQRPAQAIRANISSSV